jgi:hypothetical protein
VIATVVVDDSTDIVVVVVVVVVVVSISQAIAGSIGNFNLDAFNFRTRRCLLRVGSVPLTIFNYHCTAGEQLQQASGDGLGLLSCSTKNLFVVCS